MTHAGPFFKPVPSWDMEVARRFLHEHELDHYQLIDVRQPDEFEAGHLPGATLIPLRELPERVDEIRRDTLALVYCRSGARSGNAVAQLSAAGYRQAYNIGGILQWQGLVARGAPEAGMAWFDVAREPHEYIALAWALERRAHAFYLELAKRFGEQRELLRSLAEGEAQHEKMLAVLHGQVGGEAAELAMPAELADDDTMEGGLSQSAALAYVDERSIIDALELAAAMEANAHDRYILVGRGVGGAVQRAFTVLADAERHHLAEMMRAFNLVRPKP